MHEPLPRASQRNPRLPARVDAVFERALALDPDARFASCSAFVAALGQALEAGLETDAGAAPTMVLAPPRRSRRPWFVLATVALAALAGLLVALALDGAPRGTTTTTKLATGQPASTAAPPSPTSTAAPSPPPSTAAPSPPPAGSSLIARGQALLAQGSDLAALPLLQQANRELNGSGTTNEGRADAALARAIVGVGSCSGVISLVDRAEQLLGTQSGLEALRADCATPAPPPSGRAHGPGRAPGPGHGKGHGNGNGNGG
jgi:hypothetical protein